MQTNHQRRMRCIMRWPQTSLPHSACACAIMCIEKHEKKMKRLIVKIPLRLCLISLWSLMFFEVLEAKQPKQLIVHISSWKTHASGCFNMLQLEKSLKSNYQVKTFIKPCEWFWDLDTDHEGKAMALMLLHNSWNLLSVEDALHLQSSASAVSIPITGQYHAKWISNGSIVQVLNPSCGPKAMAEEAHVAKMAGAEFNYTGNIPGPSCWESWVGSSQFLQSS